MLNMGSDEASLLKIERMSDSTTTFPLSELRLNENGMCWRQSLKAKNPDRYYSTLLADNKHDCDDDEGGALWTAHSYNVTE